MKGITEERLKEVFIKLYWSTSDDQELFTALLSECTELNAWQPIDENTPKDRHVLLYRGHVPFCQMFVGHANSNWSWEPTHWQELPENPK